METASGRFLPTAAGLRARPLDKTEAELSWLAATKCVRGMISWKRRLDNHGQIHCLESVMDWIGLRMRVLDLAKKPGFLHRILIRARTLR